MSRSSSVRVSRPDSYREGQATLLRPKGARAPSRESGARGTTKSLALPQCAACHRLPPSERLRQKSAAAPLRSCRGGQLAIYLSGAHRAGAVTGLQVARMNSPQGNCPA